MQGNLKKVLSIVIVAVMLLSLSFTVLAEINPSSLNDIETDGGNSDITAFKLTYEEEAEEEELPEEIDVVVPAIWYPVDRDTNEVIEGLNPIATYPDMYPRTEVAKLKDGAYMVDYMGVPKPESPGSWSANNFMYTRNLWFTDKFHRVVAQGYGTFDLDEGEWQPGSSVRKIKYGSFIDEAPYDEAQGKYMGLQGIWKAPYSEGDIMELYIAVRTDDANLSDVELKSDQVDVMLDKNDGEIRQQLIDNIVEVEYYDFDNWAQRSKLDLENIATMYIYKYDLDNDTEGSFIKDEEGSYVNFIEESISTLSAGKYEVVIPIYWERNIPEYLSAPDTFSRNRYKFSDTFHFTVDLKNIAHLVTFLDYNDTVLKTETVEHGNGATAPTNPSRSGYNFVGWDKDFSNIIGDLTIKALYEVKSSNGGGSDDGGGNTDPDPDPGEIEVPDEEIPGDLPQLNTKDHFQYIQGYVDGTVKPEGNIRRDEVAAVFYRLLDGEYRESIKTSSHKFSDVTASQWANTHIATLAKGGIIKGHLDGTYKPAKYISRAELAVIASRFDNLSDSESDKFTDIEGHWANSYINSAAERGWVKGYTDGTFKPNQYITRAEFVTLVNNVLERRVRRSDILPGARQFPDLPENEWYYEAMMEAVNSHYFERLEDDYERWTEIYYHELEM